MIKTAFIYNNKLSDYEYGADHPMKPLRLRLTYELIKSYELLNMPRVININPEPASLDTLLLFHKKDYIEFLKNASEGFLGPCVYQYGLGPGDNPIFPGMYEVGTLVAGSSMSATKVVAEEKAIRSFNIAGGMHHAGSAKASGFCYFNDAVIAIKYLAGLGKRVAYIDIDAHHGDGVQNAFYDTDQVMTISLHERGETLFPGTGFVNEIGEGMGRGYSINIPLNPGTDDDLYVWVFEEIVPSLIKKFKPDIVVAQLGFDTHKSDPLANLSLTTNGYCKVFGKIISFSPYLIVLGGGGYNLSNVARGWTLCWAMMNQVEIGDSISLGYRKMASEHGIQIDTLRDKPFQEQDHIRLKAKEYLKEQIDKLKQIIFPIHGIK